MANIYLCPSDTEVEHHPNGYKYSYTVNETICRTTIALAGNPGKHGQNPGMSAGDNPNNPKTPQTLKRSQIIRGAEKILIIDESSTTVDDGCWAPQNYNPSSHFNVLSVRHDKSRE